MSWSDEFATYDEACRAHGIDTPDQLDLEMRVMIDEYRAYLAEMEAAFGPFVHPDIDTDCPF